MLPEGTVHAEHLWKRFRSDRRRALVLSEVDRLRDRLAGRDTDDRWRFALREIDFRAEPGESIGLVGANGSGKSTLLKLLTRVMYPHSGQVHVSGRVGALIEVSAGIHPQLSGRENIYLYGSLLGLRRKDVARQFDKIVAFAEVEGAIDRQVKYYSSGMRMRLGFAVAAFLEPAILLVDEVLAVGDASFQQKCLDRMRDVLAQGTTLIFVSHDLASVEATCSRGIWLDQGVMKTDGPISESLAAYRQHVEEAAETLPVQTGPVQLRKVEVTGGEDQQPRTQGPLDVELVLESDDDRSVQIFVGVSEGTATPIFSLRRDLHLGQGENEVRCHISHLPLPRGRYYLWISVFRSGQLVPWHPARRFDVSGSDLDKAPRGIVRPSPVHVDATWELGNR